MSKLFNVFSGSYGEQLRVVLWHGAPWFVLADVLNALGYEQIPDDLSLRIDHFLPGELKELNLDPALAGLRIIAEADFYRLVYTCKKIDAGGFIHWVEDTLLHEIKELYNKSVHGKQQKELQEENPQDSGHLQVFKDNNFGSVRVLERNGEPWFAAMDVAKALGYTNPQKAIIDHCKYAKLLKGNESLLLTESPRGINIIPEADVYALIFRSNLPKAELFRDWVYKEVLPSIRKTGEYAVKPEQRIDWEILKPKVESMKILLDECNASQNVRIIALGNLVQEETGFDVLEACGIDLSTTAEEPSLTASDMARLLGGDYNASGVNMRLIQMGLLRYLRHEYELTNEGSKFGMELPPVFIGRGKKRKIEIIIKWKPIVVDMIRVFIGKAYCPVSACSYKRLYF